MVRGIWGEFRGVLGADGGSNRDNLRNRQPEKAPHFTQRRMGHPAAVALLDGSRAAKDLRRARHASPLQSCRQTCDIPPSTCAGHGILCPYEATTRGSVAARE